MGSKFELYLHLVWATWRRRPMVGAEIEGELYRAIGAKCVDLRCSPCAIGGTADHVHLLSRLHPSISVARLAAEVKGCSSHAITHRIAPESRFRWQAGYGAYSISLDDLPAVESYVRNQKHHHALQAIEPELESMTDT
jgi:putative transposase